MNKSHNLTQFDNSHILLLSFNRKQKGQRNTASDAGKRNDVDENHGRVVNEEAANQRNTKVSQRSREDQDSSDPTCHRKQVFDIREHRCVTRSCCHAHHHRSEPKCESRMLSKKYQPKVGGVQNDKGHNQGSGVADVESDGYEDDSVESKTFN